MGMAMAEDKSYAMDFIEGFDLPVRRAARGAPSIFELVERGDHRGAALVADTPRGRATDARGRNALMHAAFNAQAQCVRALLRHFDPNNVDSNGDTALMIAAGAGCERCVAMLLAASHPASANAFGLDALMHAARNGHLGCVHQLVGPCDPRARDHNGHTALMHAAMAGQAECLSSLAAASDLRARDKSGRTALMLAAAMAHVECVELLAETGSDARSDVGDTALMWAARGAHSAAAPGLCEREMRCVDILLARGLSNASNQHGQTAASIARGRGADTMARRIEEVAFAEDEWSELNICLLAAGPRVGRRASRI